MSKHNFLMQNGFQGCGILGHRRDTCRNRNVTLYHLKDSPGLVGYFDGVDSFIIDAGVAGPDIVSAAARADAGEANEIEFGQTKRRLLDEPGVNGNPSYLPLPVRTRERRSARPTPVRHSAKAAVSMTEVQADINEQKPKAVKERRRAHD